MTKEGKKKGLLIVWLGVPFLLVVALVGYIGYTQLNAKEDVTKKIDTTAALKNLFVLEDDYFKKEGKYASDLKQLDYQPKEGITIEFVSADKECFKAKATHLGLGDTFWVDCKAKLYRQRAGSSVLEVL